MERKNASLARMVCDTLCINAKMVNGNVSVIVLRAILTKRIVPAVDRAIRVKSES